MRGLHAGRIAWDWRSLEKPARSLTAISIALCAAFIALFLCILASVFGAGPDGGWFALPPDYTALGWTIRLTGAVLGLGAFIYLSIILQPYRGRRRGRSYPAKLIKTGLLLAAASITWEIAILATVILGALAGIYMLFGEDGI